MIFYGADGYRVIENRDELKNPNLKQWANFISKLKDKILKSEFQSSVIRFIPPLTKAQVFKLKRNNPNIDKVFLEESGSETIE